MGLDCSRPSREFTELYLPADTLRVCNPRETCWCDRGHHRDSRYYYVERGGDGRERFHDPFDYMDRFMTGGGWPMPWKDVQNWTTRDYDRLGEIMAEYHNRLRGRQMGTWGAMPPWMTMMPAMMMADDLRSPCHPRRHRRGGPGRTEYDGFVEWVEQLARDHKKLREAVYGSDAELREEQYKRRLQKHYQEMQQQAMNGGMFGMNGLNTMGGMGMPGMMNPNMGMGMGMGGMMPQQFAAMGGAPGMAGAPGMSGMGAMGMNGMMPGAGMPGAGMPSMNGFGDDMLGGGLGGGLGRRGAFGRTSRRRGLPMADELDDEFPDLLGGRRRRRRGGRHWGDGDLDDDLGGLDGE